MNQNFYNSSGFDQIQPSQYPVMSEEILQAKQNLMKSIETFLKKFNRISFREMPKVLSQAWENFFEIQHAQPEDIHELLHKLLEDFQIIKNSSNAIAPVLPTEEPDNSLSMGDEHLSTIPKTKLDELINSSVENLVPIPSEYKVTSDTLIDSSPKFDYLLELAHIDPIPLGIEEADLDLEEEIRLVENLVYDNSSPRSPEELNAEIDDMILEALSTTNMTRKGDIHYLEEFLSNDPLPIPENKSSNFDHHDDPSFPRPSPEPPDVKIFFDFDPDTCDLTAKVVEDISEHHVLMPKVLPTQPTLCLNIDPFLQFSSDNEDKVFKPGILSYLLVSHRDKTISDFSESPMIMIAPGLEASRARCFVHRPLELQSFAYENPISEILLI
nr:hypothetical protein [Tanacetum cinerariifolium]